MPKCQASFVNAAWLFQSSSPGVAAVKSAGAMSAGVVRLVGVPEVSEVVRLVGVSEVSEMLELVGVLEVLELVEVPGVPGVRAELAVAGEWLC